MSELELVKVSTGEATYKRKAIPLPVYDVVLDGQKIGRVRRAMITHERRSPGMRYVNARWQSPGWRYEVAERNARSWECRTRLDGIKRVLREAAGLGYTEAEQLAATAKNVR